MPFREPASREHTPTSIGVLLTNVGTPAAPTTAALRPYLAQFLGDERVIEYPRWLWRPLLHGVILNTRPRRSAELYRHVWTDDGSPLLVILRRQAAALAAALPAAVKVIYGLRYGEPSIAAALRELDAAGARRVLVFPLYPQYSATTTATSLDAVFEELRTWRWVPELRTINQYHADPHYIAALAASVREYWARHGRGQRLLMSFHGIPQEYARKGDPYPGECNATARLVAEALGLGSDEYAATFQSRFGPSDWLQPYTDETLAAWGREGLTRIDAICPGFSADCLETVDEIGREGAHKFREAGGGELRYIPALNDRPDHVAMLEGLVMAHLSGWMESSRSRGTAP
ncbi:ferrochelatase [Promineifilum sp.]|uniref:ferrochelatase n=1 Tax=Promineifilum sp. TaxID=2664178 RepID=UPI0035B1CBC9